MKNNEIETDALNVAKAALENANIKGNQADGIIQIAVQSENFFAAIAMIIGVYVAPELPLTSTIEKDAKFIKYEPLVRDSDRVEYSYEEKATKLIYWKKTKFATKEEALLLYKYAPDEWIDYHEGDYGYASVETGGMKTVKRTCSVSRWLEKQ